jgi:hypothetical protein
MLPRNVKIFAILFGLIVAVIFVVWQVKPQKENPVMDVIDKTRQVISGDNEFGFDETTEGYENFTQLVQGCPFKDCIPSIDQPQFESVKEASSWLKDEDILFVLETKNEVRAYPQRILNWHEIVNDEVDEEALAITFCPLCGSSLAFEREIDGQILEFGVSGKLHNNDLVMYDRNTLSLWQQITGEAIVGPMFGKKLKQVSLSGMRWEQFNQDFEDALVLSRDTGFSRNYDTSPYGDYEQERSLLLIEVDGNFKAYPEEKIKEEGLIEDTVEEVAVSIAYNDGDIVFKDSKSDQEIVATRLFWFAWKAFRPDTKLY